MTPHGRLPEQFVAEVLERTDIVEVIGGYVKLRRSGKEFAACCPFPDHSEKTPSFTVNPAKRFYHCFGCGRHGSAVGFLMEFGRMGFRQAMAELARRLGMRLPVEQLAKTPERQWEREAVKANHQLHAFFEKSLPQCLDALGLWGIDESTARRLRLGYAPPRSGLPAASAATMHRAGLMTSDGIQPLADRLVIPVRANSGAILGFVSASLPGQPASPAYLCGLSSAREHLIAAESPVSGQRTADTFVVFTAADWLQLVGCGVSAAMAPLPYVLGPHLQRIRRLADKVVVCVPDGSVGDAVAALTAHHYADLVGPNRIALLILSYEPDKPIGTLARKLGADAIKRLAADAKPLFDVALRSLPSRLDRNSPKDRQRYLGHIVRFASARNRAAAAVAVQWLVNAWNLPQTEVIELLRRAGVDPASVLASAAATGTAGLATPERLFRLLLAAPDCAQHLPNTLSDSDESGMSLVRELSAYLRSLPLASANDAATFIANHPDRSLLEHLGSSGTDPYEHVGEIAEALEYLRHDPRYAQVERDSDIRGRAGISMANGRQRDGRRG